MSQKLLCNECFSSAIQQDHQGMFVCGDCGLVLPDLWVQDTQRQIRQDKNGKYQFQSSVLIQAGTLIGNDSERKFNAYYTHLQQVQNMALKKPVSASTESRDL